MRIWKSHPLVTYIKKSLTGSPLASKITYVWKYKALIILTCWSLFVIYSTVESAYPEQYCNLLVGDYCMYLLFALQGAIIIIHLDIIVLSLNEENRPSKLIWTYITSIAFYFILLSIVCSAALFCVMYLDPGICSRLMEITDIKLMYPPPLNIPDPFGQLDWGFQRDILISRLDWRIPPQFPPNGPTDPRYINQPFASYMADALAQHPTAGNRLSNSMFNQLEVRWLTNYLAECRPDLYSQVIDGLPNFNQWQDTPRFWKLFNNASFRDGIRNLPWHYY